MLWVGTVLLESISLHNKGVSKDIFLQEWRDQLLESWRKDASMDLLKVTSLVRTLDSNYLTSVTRANTHRRPRGISSTVKEPVTAHQRQSLLPLPSVRHLVNGMRSSRIPNDESIFRSMMEWHL